MPAKLFGNKIPPACMYCRDSLRRVEKGERILCLRKGIVPLDYKCRKYVYDPLKRIPKRPAPMEHFSKDDFKL